MSLNDNRFKCWLCGSSLKSIIKKENDIKELRVRLKKENEDLKIELDYWKKQCDYLIRKHKID